LFVLSKYQTLKTHNIILLFIFIFIRKIGVILSGEKKSWQGHYGGGSTFLTGLSSLREESRFPPPSLKKGKEN
jgi:hypothetical protein